jgi:hypothetical protein
MPQEKADEKSRQGDGRRKTEMPEISLNPPSDGRSERKAFVRDLLLKRDLKSFISWTETHRDASRILNYLLFDGDELVRWRAIEAVGQLAALRARTSLEGPRQTIRRMLWAMNDESGNSFWHAPEVIGEVIARVPRLTKEFVNTIPPLMKLEPYERGVHWAMARIAGVSPEAFADSTDTLIKSISDPDPYVRSFAMLALSPEGIGKAAGRIESCLEDEEHFRSYNVESGSFDESAVGQIARRVLACLR